MFEFGSKILTKWGIDICTKMLSATQEAYGDYIEQINSGLIKKVIPVPKQQGNYGFELNAELYKKFMQPAASEFILKGFKLKDVSGKSVDGRIYFRNGMISSFFVKPRINAVKLSVCTKNLRKLTLLNRLPKKIMDIICQYDGIDISAVYRVEIANQIIYHLITMGNNFIGIEENSGAFVEVANETLEIKPFTVPFSDYLRNAPKEYLYEGLPRKVLNIISLHSGIDIRNIYRVDIKNQIIYHLLPADDGNFIGIEVGESKFVYVTHNPLKINVLTKNIDIYTVDVDGQKIYHLFDTGISNFIGIKDDGGEFVEVTKKPFGVRLLECDSLDCLM